MSWIKTLGDDESDKELGALFEKARDPANGKLDEIMRVHSLHPEGLDAHLRLYTAVMKGTKTLPRVDREMIALVVSRINECHY